MGRVGVVRRTSVWNEEKLAAGLEGVRGRVLTWCAQLADGVTPIYPMRASRARGETRRYGRGESEGVQKKSRALCALNATERDATLFRGLVVHTRWERSSSSVGRGWSQRWAQSRPHSQTSSPLPTGWITASQWSSWPQQGY